MYGYAALWFTTPFFAASLVLSLLAIVASRRDPRIRARAAADRMHSLSRPAPTLVLGETHFVTTRAVRRRPTWLTIPQRGLYTGVMVLGAVGTGKTSACMYPYVEQLLRWRAQIPTRSLVASCWR